MIEAYIRVVDAVMRRFGYDSPIAECMDDLLNGYLGRNGLEYVRMERLG